MTLSIRKKTSIKNGTSATRESKKENASENHKKKSSETETVYNQDSSINGIGSYEFLSTLGSGKFSRVMLANHIETQEKFAIKVSEIYKLL
jgi:hypothetical protein